MGKYYTVYDERTEEIIAFGNASQCTAILGLKIQGNSMHLFLKHVPDCEKITRSLLRMMEKNQIQNN